MNGQTAEGGQKGRWQGDSIETSHPSKYGRGARERIGPEEDPSDNHSQKRAEPCHCRRNAEELSQPRALTRRPPSVIDCQVHAMEASPYDERPVGAVPEPAQDHRDENVDVPPDGA